MSWRFVVAAVVHAMASLLCKWGLGVDIEADPKRNAWDWFWQHLPIDELRAHLLRSLWDLHSQPPLHNLWGGLSGILFHPQHLQALNYFNILLGAMICGMLSVVLEVLTRRPKLSVIAATLIGLTPIFFLYEAYMLYEMEVAFWVTASVFFAALYQQTRRPRFLALMVLALNLLVLTRSLYHVALLAPVIGAVGLLERAQWKRWVTIGLAITLLSSSWYVKNAVRFGFFGASSWAGQSLWRIARAFQPRHDMRRYRQAGLLDPIVFRKPVMSRPSRYRDLGFTKTSDSPVLSRNDHNNINMVDISRAYGRNAVRLIAVDPLHYLSNVGKAYQRFSKPSARYKHLAANRPKIARWERFYSQVIFGGGTVWVFLFPASLLAHTAWLARRPTSEQPALWLMTYLFAYTTLLACAAEYGENERYKFAIEPLFYVYLLNGAVLIYASVRRTAWFRGGSA